MDTQPRAFVPPHPIPSTEPPTALGLIRTVVRNPIEIWGEYVYNNPYAKAHFLHEHTLIANDPGLVRHILVDNHKNFRMSRMRQLILKPILQEGLITAEGEIWKRTRKTVAPVFAPRHIKGFADMMQERIETFLDRYRNGEGEVHDISIDMTDLTYEVLSKTLFYR
jgi:cytochrome P450